MSCEKIKSIVDSKDSIIVDVRTNVEFLRGHIKGAYTIPVDMIGSTINKLRDKNVYLYCQSGARSEHVRRFLEANNIHAFNMGGINNFIGCLEF